MLDEQTTLKLKFPLFLLHLCYFSPANMSHSLCGPKSISNSSGVENIVFFLLLLLSVAMVNRNIGAPLLLAFFWLWYTS